MINQKNKLIAHLEKLKTLKKQFGDLLSKKIEGKSPKEIEIIISGLISEGNNLDDFNAARHVLDDCNDAIKSFIKSGGFDDANRGESLLKLYGALNATYIQQEMVKGLSKSANIKKEIENLKIRRTRNNFASHPKRTISKTPAQFFVIHPNDSINFKISYSTRKNEGCYEYFGFLGEKFTGADIEQELMEHLEFMTSFFANWKIKLERS